MSTIVLGIEHTNPSERSPAKVALCRVANDSVECLVEHAVPVGAGERLTATIDALFSGQYARKDIEEIAVSIGPGGFTSTRIGVVAAQMIAFSLSLPVRCVPTTDVVARRSCAPGRIGVALAWRRGSAWFATYNDGTLEQSGYLATRDEILRSRVSTVVCSEKAAEGLAGPDASQSEVAVMLAEFSATAVVAASRTIMPTEPQKIQPMYPRGADALTIEERRRL